MNISIKTTAFEVDDNNSTANIGPEYSAGIKVSIKLGIIIAGSFELSDSNNSAVSRSSTTVMANKLSVAKDFA